MQHPAAAAKAAKRDREAADQERREAAVKAVIKKVRGRKTETGEKGTWDLYEFG